MALTPEPVTEVGERDLPQRLFFEETDYRYRLERNRESTYKSALSSARAEISGGPGFSFEYAVVLMLVLTLLVGGTYIGVGVVENRRVRDTLCDSLETSGWARRRNAPVYLYSLDLAPITINRRGHLDHDMYLVSSGALSKQPTPAQGVYLYLRSRTQENTKPLTTMDEPALTAVSYRERSSIFVIYQKEILFLNLENGAVSKERHDWTGHEKLRETGILLDKRYILEIRDGGKRFISKKTTAKKEFWPTPLEVRCS